MFAFSFVQWMFVQPPACVVNALCPSPPGWQICGVILRAYESHQRVSTCNQQKCVESFDNRPQLLTTCSAFREHCCCHLTVNQMKKPDPSKTTTASPPLEGRQGCSQFQCVDMIVASVLPLETVNHLPPPRFCLQSCPRPSLRTKGEIQIQSYVRASFLRDAKVL